MSWNKEVLQESSLQSCSTQFDPRHLNPGNDIPVAEKQNPLAIGSVGGAIN